MKVTIKGKGSTTLTKNDFIASGGFGDIYIKGSTAYKIFQDSKTMIPEAKIQELSILSENNIIKPEDIILDDKNKTVGYTMRAVSDSYALCQIFPKPFRTRNNVKPDDIVRLVRRMQETIDKIHKNKILIVDLNEMNFLVNKKFDEVYFIDVDSYQTRNFPAVALMESVRDRHSNTFSEKTDWFSFAIVSFQMFRAIHPYKGRHPVYSDMNDRMLKNLSVLNPEVSYPQGAVLPLDVIPDIYQQWYYAVLEEGKRLPPPSGLVNLIHVVTQQVKTLSGKLFDITELSLFSRKTIIGDVLSLYHSGNIRICLTNKNIYNENTGFECTSHGNVAVGFSPKMNHPIAAHVDNYKISFTDIARGTPIPYTFPADSLMDYDGRIYYKYESNIIEVNLLETGSTLVRPTVLVVANVMERATQLFPGCAIQNILGTYFVNIFPEHGKSFQIKLPELNASQVIAAKYNNHVLMVVVSQEGKYHRYIFIIDKTYKTYQVRSVRDINYTGLNFVVLPQGICVVVNEDDSIELFSNDSKANAVKNLTDDSVQGIMLLQDGSQVVFHRNEKFYNLKMK